MKILIVNTFYYPNMQGGTEQVVKILAENLVKAGNEVAILCIDSKNDDREVCNYNGVKIFRFKSQKFNLYKFSYDKKNLGKFEKIKQKLICYYNKECIKYFEEVCEIFNPDVVHTHSIYGISKGIWRKSSQLKIPIVHTIHNIDIISPVQYGHKANFIIKLFHKIYMKNITKYVDVVTAPSEYTLNSSLKTGSFKNSKIKKCVYNGVKVNHKEIRDIINQKRLRNDNKIKFMYAGRLIYFKGVEHMINAFKNLKNENCELHICGNGEMQEFVENATKEDKRIIYHGKLNNQELANCYKDCDVLIVPSNWPEPFGMIIIEGNMYGLPVIASNCGGIPEIIQKTKGGLIYSHGNDDELTNKMNEFLNRKVINSFFDDILKNIDIYNVNNQILEFERLYDFIMEEKK